MFLLRTTLAGAALALLAGTAHAATPVLFGTGLDAAGTPLAPGAVDGHYTVDGGGFDDAPVFATHNASGYPGYWMAPGGGSAWIAPQLAGLDAAALPAAVYTYTTRFDLAGYDAATARIEGRIAADDTVSAILLNGQDIGFTHTGYSSFKDFTIASGFVAGLNTLSFVVGNGGGGPTGVRAELDAVLTPVPEPGAALLMAGGAAALLVLLRRRAVPALSR